MNWLISALARGAVVAALAATSAAMAQSYPTRPITLVAPFPPGASVDGLARITRDSLSETARADDRHRESHRRRRHHGLRTRSPMPRPTATRC